MNMPTITLSKKELGVKLSDEKLADRISMLGTDLEEIKGDDIHVEIFPNRPDLLSQAGFNRAFKSFIGEETGLKKYPVTKGTTKIIIEKSTKECRPYTACAVVRGLSIDKNLLEEIVKIQEKLHVTFGRNRKRAAIGIYPLERITTPITFKGMKPEEIRFTPLDGKEMSAKQILEEHKKGKEYAHLLKGLKRYACFVDADNNIMSLTPIINSRHVGCVTTNTKDLFIECSGHDFRVLEQALAMIVTALADMGGTIESCELEYQHSTLGTITTPRLEPTTRPFDLEYTNKKLGLELTDKEAKKLLEKMGYGYEKGRVLIPAYRADIMHQADLAEDVAIAYGYENFKPEIPQTATVGEESKASIINNKIREVMIGHGLVETKNYHLISESIQQLTSKNYTKLSNSISKEFDTLRNDVLVSLFATLGRNKSYEYPQKIFEIGTAFREEETTQLAIILCGEKEDYTSIRQTIDNLLRAMGTQATFEETTHQAFLKGRTANIKKDKENVGFIGEVNPKILDALRGFAPRREDFFKEFLTPNMKTLKTKLNTIAPAMTTRSKGISNKGTKYKESTKRARAITASTTVVITKVITARAHKPCFCAIINKLLRKLTIGPLLSPSKRAFTRQARKTN